MWFQVLDLSEFGDSIPRIYTTINHRWEESESEKRLEEDYCLSLCSKMSCIIIMYS